MRALRSAEAEAAEELRPHMLKEDKNKDIMAMGSAETESCRPPGVGEAEGCRIAGAVDAKALQAARPNYDKQRGREGRKVGQDRECPATGAV